MGVDKKYMITYTETTTYEELVIAETPEEAKRGFEIMLQDGNFEPKSLDIVEYEVEED